MYSMIINLTATNITATAAAAVIRHAPLNIVCL